MKNEYPKSNDHDIEIHFQAKGGLLHYLILALIFFALVIMSETFGIELTELVSLAKSILLIR